MPSFLARVPAFHRPDWSPCPDTLPTAPKKPAAAYAKAVPPLPAKPLPTVFCPSSKSPPVPSRTEGESSRYHLCFAAFSQKRPQGVPSRTPALYRAHPSGPTGGNPVQAAAPRGIRRRSLSPFHQTRGSLGRKTAVTGPHLCVDRMIPQWALFVKSFIPAAAQSAAEPWTRRPVPPCR